MALDPLNSNNLKQLALKGLMYTNDYIDDHDTKVEHMFP